MWDGKRQPTLWANAAQFGRPPLAGWRRVAVPAVSAGGAVQGQQRSSDNYLGLASPNAGPGGPAPRGLSPGKSTPISPGKPQLFLKLYHNKTMSLAVRAASAPVAAAVASGRCRRGRVLCQASHTEEKKPKQGLLGQLRELGKSRCPRSSSCSAYHASPETLLLCHATCRPHWAHHRQRHPLGELAALALAPPPRIHVCSWQS